jgi:pimeloyl-[acyl-carrier protein] synthase
MPTAVEELLRYDSPVRLTARTACVDTTLEGRSLQAGDQVIALLHVANHDPTAFESPHRLDITRDARHHVSLGGGAHYCLGASLARAEAQIALTALTALPGLELASDKPVWRPLHALHGLATLPVTCSPA